MGKLAGYKTYVVAGLAILGAAAAYFMGEADMRTTIEAVVAAVLAMTIRHGVAAAPKA
jgi:VIT1/CCC1 family predicted Fe2+/Mn2+ transporter